MKRKVMILGSISITYIGFVIAFFLGKAMAALQGIEYRFWLSALGYSLILIVPMVLIALWARLGFAAMIEKRGNAGLSSKGCQVARIVTFIVYAVICCCIIGVCYIFALFTMHEERTTQDGTIEVMYGGWPGEAYWFDYEPVSFWGRKKAIGIAAQKKLEEKYGCSFTVDDRALDIGTVFYIPENDPELSVIVYGNQEDGEEVVDDYASQYLTRIFLEGEKNLDTHSESGSVYFAHPYYEYYLYIQDTEENRKVIAEDAAALITNALEQLKQDEDAPCAGGVLHVAVMHNPEARAEAANQSVSLPFGETGEKDDTVSGDYYTSAEHVYQEIQDKIPVYVEEPFADEETSANDEENIYGDGNASNEGDATGMINEDIDSAEPSWESEIEELARCIYDEELADTEDYFEMTYSAKGNPYAILGEGEKELITGKTITTRQTLVYDRTSQNGKCELFVYYKEKYYLDGTPLDTSDILDMYAVDKESHEVYPSGRHAWADVGNKEYREATGE